MSRKHTLEYDDVLNQQRDVIYTYRDEVLEGRDISDAAREEIVNLIDRLVGEYTVGEFVEDWDVEGLMRRIEEIFEPSEELAAADHTRMDREDLAARLQEEALANYDRREQELGEELMRVLERVLLLEIIDQRWQEHLYDMDYLQQGIDLRGFAQIEPLVAYKNEAFELFRDLMHSVWGDFARLIFHVEVTLRGSERRTAAPVAPEPDEQVVDGPRPGHVLGRQLRRLECTRDGRRGRGRGVRRGAGAAADAGRRAASRRRVRADRSQRPVLVRLRQEVQEVPRRLRAPNGTGVTFMCPRRLTAPEALLG